MKIGVLALQGAFREHLLALRDLGADGTAVKRPDDLAGIDRLIIPGGESTTMSMLLDSSELRVPMQRCIDDGVPVMGTCAGMILLATEVIDGRPDQRSFGAIDIAVRRNAFGRQVDSFEANLDVAGMGGGPFPAVFIRAPFVERAGPAVEVLASVDGHPVLCRQGDVVVTSFHPELSGDLRVHSLFIGGR